MTAATWVRVLDPAGHRAAAGGPVVTVFGAEVTRIAVEPPDLWVCDACNRALRGPGAPADPEPLLIGPDGWGTICAGCRDRYHGGAAVTLGAAAPCGCLGCSPA